jgi:hypothetical protein
MPFVSHNPLVTILTGNQSQAGHQKSTLTEA